ncbi:MAG TPA: hypothetical protein VHG89_03340 [Verrucomicrobiae bacterium]|nr:hypothetical protein [Verrucomicrobiae bacterium]
MNGNNISAAQKPLHRKIYLLVNRFMFAISRKHSRDDIEIAMLFDKNGSAVSSKINQALNLISEFDSRRYHQIKRDVKKIWVAAAPGYCAQWIDELQTCILDTKYFRRADVLAPEMALTIVHEATHARLFKLKIGYTEDIRKRVERIYIKSEIAFAKRLPGGQKLVEMAKSRLQTSGNYWTNAQFQERDLDTLADISKKNWVVRILYPIVKRKVDKRNAHLRSLKKD